jgi:SAM-dependent methyltransferase
MTPAAADGEDRFADIRGYAEQQRAIPLAAREDEFDTALRRVGKLTPVGPGSSMLEMGIGGGAMLVLAAKRGLRATGVEHNPELAELARELAREEGVEIEVKVGSAESFAVEPGSYDVVVAFSVLEHVPDYRAAIANAYAALRPGGVFYFDSTNKFALRSGEYPPIRLYGWLPYRVRRHIREKRQSPTVVLSGGMDFNQFTYPGLRRRLKRTGFSRVLDLYELLDVEDLNNPTPLRKAVMRAYKAFPPLRWLLTTFSAGTYFYCVK